MKWPEEERTFANVHELDRPANKLEEKFMNTDANRAYCTIEVRPPWLHRAVHFQAFITLVEGGTTCTLQVGDWKHNGVSLTDDVARTEVLTDAARHIMKTVVTAAIPLRTRMGR
ncbi:MAG: hypothetical protein QM820_23945 [Minicystis sp.]